MLVPHVPYHLFPTCIPVRGYSRSVIIDLHLNNYKFIPNSLCDILEKHNGKTIESIKSEFDEVEHQTIDEYFLFLSDNNYIHFSENIVFKNLSNDFTAPELYSNAFVEIGHEIPCNVLDQLSEANCLLVQLKFTQACSFDFFIEVLEYVNKLRITNIHCYLQYSDEIKAKWDEVLQRTVKLTRCFFLNSPEYSEIKYGVNDSYVAVFLEKQISKNLHCGNIHPQMFRVSKRMVFESMQYNSCLHKKIFIDKNGNMKNCPYSNNVLGNVTETPLVSIVNSSEYKDLSSIRKDNIDVCKDCEFRYLCLDCRVYVSDSNKLSQPAKCTYNPYIAKWNGQEGYVSVSEWIALRK
ncbi:MAG: grasp-with-spasm system SPASM domain peptide maturase [Bacteroidaceae bacterium]|nr:grasp-with-spasm system SPASM domain peptide maturase [Bacteroidaceae bacterium]